MRTGLQKAMPAAKDQDIVDEAVIVFRASTYA